VIIDNELTPAFRRNRGERKNADLRDGARR
jgi:hypothetical protein